MWLVEDYVEISLSPLERTVFAQTAHKSTAITLDRKLQKSGSMRKLLPSLALAGLFLASAPTANAQVSFSLHLGEPPAPRAYRVPRQPGPDYLWIEGYWYPDGGHYKWHDGYWTHAPYEGAYWVAPYYLHGEYFPGRWEGSRGNLYHDHRWDRAKQRDERHEPPPPRRDDDHRDHR